MLHLEHTWELSTLAAMAQIIKRCACSRCLSLRIRCLSLVDLMLNIRYSRYVVQLQANAMRNHVNLQETISIQAHRFTQRKPTDTLLHKLHIIAADPDAPQGAQVP